MDHHRRCQASALQDLKCDGRPEEEMINRFRIKCGRSTAPSDVFCPLAFSPLSLPPVVHAPFRELDSGDFFSWDAEIRVNRFGGQCCSPGVRRSGRESSG
jgi:hypothetical protein